MTVGIYSIHNTISGKRYIGQSHNVEGRFEQHKDELRKGVHRNYHLQSAWDKYNEDVFAFSLLLICEEADLLEKEIALIAQHNSYDRGYNLTRGGDGAGGLKWTNAQKNRQADLQIEIQNRPEVLAKHRTRRSYNRRMPCVVDGVEYGSKKEAIKALDLAGYEELNAWLQTGVRPRPKKRRHIVLTPEVRKSRSAARTGGKNGSAVPITIAGVAYSSIREAGDALGITSRSRLRRMAEVVG